MGMNTGFNPKVIPTSAIFINLDITLETSIAILNINKLKIMYVKFINGTQKDKVCVGMGCRIFPWCSLPVVRGD